jgi:hypothetical protein
MAYTGTIVTEAEMTFMAGELVDGTGNIEANHNYLAFYAEAYLSALVKYDIVTNWVIINAKTRALFTEWAARFAACDCIKYNMAGYTSRIEAEDMINYHVYRMEAIEKILTKMGVQDFIGA